MEDGREDYPILEREFGRRNFLGRVWVQSMHGFRNFIYKTKIGTFSHLTGHIEKLFAKDGESRDG